MCFESQQLPSLRRLDRSGSESLKRTSDFTRMPNLEYLGLRKCRSLEEVHHSLRYSRKLILLNLMACVSLERFPYVNVESLEFLDLFACDGLEIFPEFIGRMKSELHFRMQFSGIRKLPSSVIHPQAHLTELDLIALKNLVSLPSSICKLKGLVTLDVSNCSDLESLLEEIDDLEKLEKLDASYTLISRPSSSLIRLNKLKILNFEKEESEDRSVCFVFPQVTEGLLSLEMLNLCCCNLIDGGLPEDIGSLSSLQELDLSGNNFEHLPRSIAQLGALRSLDLSGCKRLKQLPEFPQQLNTIYADWSSDWICNWLFQNISSLQHDISVSDIVSPRVFTSWMRDGNIPSWFHHQGRGASLSVNLREDWYVSDNFLGFVVCYSGDFLYDITAHLIPLCDDGMSSMTQEFAISDNSEYTYEWLDGYETHFLLVPLAGLWDASKANGKTPNDFEMISLYFGEVRENGVRLLYKNEPELHIEITRSRYEEACCCFPLLQLFPTRPGL